MIKKLLVVGVAAAGVFAWRKATAERNERDLWAEATDPID